MQFEQNICKTFGVVGSSILDEIEMGKQTDQSHLKCTKFDQERTLVGLTKTYGF